MYYGRRYDSTMYTEEEMLRSMRAVRPHKEWLEKRTGTNKCFRSLKGTVWWPVMVLGGWLGLYWTFTYHLLLAALVLALEVGVAAGSALWKQDYGAAGRYGLILAFPVFLLVSLWLVHGPDNVAWLAKEREVLVSCTAYRAAHPGIPGYEDASALLEHVEEWLQKFEHLRNKEEESQMPFMGRVCKVG